MYEFEVRSAIRDYRVRFIDSASEVLLAELRPGDVLLVDSFVAKQLDFSGVVDEDTHIIEIAPSEEAKSYEGVKPVIQSLLDVGFRKNERLVAVGGGVVQDVTAFVASVMFRGVEWLFFPSTLLAQCDSCIGSKTSINFGAFKNQLGNFYPPSKVFIDLKLLESLPDKELHSGLGEMAHYYLVSGEEDLARFAREAPDALEDHEILKGMVAHSLQIKKSFIEKDEFDRTERQVLNYGHSFGHALESLTSYGLPHGIAVSYGMDIANFVSMKLGLLSAGDRLRMREILEPIWRPYPLPSFDLTEFMRALRKDKKNVGSQLGLILSEGPGNTSKRLVDVTPEFEGWLTEYFDAEVPRA
jgi:3-dehydroquinate synthase